MDAENLKLLKFRLHTINRRWFNTTLIRRRNFDGHIVSMNQSGSHWIKNLLAHVLMEKYNLPPLKHVQDDSIIGHPKSMPIYDAIPCIVHSHGFPHALTLKIPFLKYPKYLVLVRDIRDSLISNYERFKGQYGDISFSEFLRCDLGDKRMVSDLYSRIRFMNEWGEVLKKYPSRTHLMRYEDLQRDTIRELGSVLNFFDIEVDSISLLERAIENCSREKMAKKPNPEIETTVIRTSHKSRDEYFTQENLKYLEEICSRYLKHNLGYDLPNIK